jgi:FMN reductase
MTAQFGSNGRPIRLVGIGGSTRKGSHSLVALKAALRLAEEAGAETVLADVRELALPVYNADWQVADYPPSLAWLLDEVRASDGLILCSPTYHGTVTGAVKNVLDALDFMIDDTPSNLGGRPVGLMAYGGQSAVNVLNALHHAVRGLNGHATKTFVAVPGSAFDDRWVDVTEEGVLKRLGTMVGEVIEHASLRRLANDAAVTSATTDD